MDVSNESPLENEFDQPANQEEFASGSPNKIRLSVLRLTQSLFGPPYFPTELIWFLLAVIAGNIAVVLFAQPDEYWIDPSRSINTFRFFPEKWGLLSVGILAIYMVLVGLTLSLINSWSAFVIWLGLSFFHLVDITQSFRCGVTYFLPFENPGNCSELHTLVILLAGITWGIGILVAAQKGLVSWTISSDNDRVTISAWGNRLGYSSKILIVLLLSAVIIKAVSVPRPYWRAIQVENKPAGRTEASLAYDTKRSIAVLFGGTVSWTQTTGWNSANDTWEWNGSEWNQLHPIHNPSPRMGASMAFDEERGITILFGGSRQDTTDSRIFLGDTWEWDGKDWTVFSPSLSPPARESASMFFDPMRRTVVLFGGYFFDQLTQTAIFLEDVWEWNGKNWQQIDFAQPHKTTIAAIVYDPLHQLPLLMDGEGLWSMQEGYWSQPNTSNSPPSRWASEMVFDSRHQEVVLFGGSMNQEIFSDTWLYDGQSWRQVITESEPPRRGGHNLFFDQSRETVILFGGLEGGTIYNDMWELIRP